MIKQFKGRCIYQYSNGEYPVEVFDNWRFRWLRFGSHYIQSVIQKRNPHRPMLSYMTRLCLLCSPLPSKTLLLGLGAGAMVHYLQHNYSNDITAVELDTNIANIAKDYFKLDENNLTINIEDANCHVKKTTEKYDNILIDLFDDTNFPTSCNNNEFFQQCKRLLKPKGILSLNIVNYPQQKKLLEFIKLTFNNQSLALPVADYGNLIIHASPDQSMLEIAQQLIKEKKLTNIEWNPMLGLMAYH